MLTGRHVDSLHVVSGQVDRLTSSQFTGRQLTVDTYHWTWVVGEVDGFLTKHK